MWKDLLRVKRIEACKGLLGIVCCAEGPVDKCAHKWSLCSLRCWVAEQGSDLQKNLSLTWLKFDSASAKVQQSTKEKRHIRKFRVCEYSRYYRDYQSI